MVRIAVEGEAGRVVNGGRIEAGRVLLTAADAARTLDAAINTTGVIRARSGSATGGRIELIGRGSGAVRISGTLDASGGRRGGEVTVTGGKLAIGPQARISASGGEDGGTVRLGGDRQGGGSLRRAGELAIAAGARIAADGATGRGGSVVAWSDGVTRVDGAISATGPLAGGFIETSGAGALALGPLAAVSAGAGGQWLLDPRDVLIANGSATPPIAGGTQTPPVGTGAYSISRIALQNALNAGSDVTVTTVQPGSHMQGDITVDGPLSWTGAGSLRLQRRARHRDRRQRDHARRRLQRRGRAHADRRGGCARHRRGGGRAVGVHRRSQARPRGGGQPHRRDRDRSAGARRSGREGDFAPAGRGGRRHPARIYSGDVDIAAGEKIVLRGATHDGQWVRVGSEDSSSAVTLAAPHIDVLGGKGDNSFAELVTGAGGSLTLRGDEIHLRNMPGGAEARIVALGGADLTLDAARQTWRGAVQAGSGISDGGDVRLSGAITATVRPLFSLADGADFVLAAATPGGAASSYSSPVPLTVSTSGAGSVSVAAPIAAEQVTLVSQERVRLDVGARLTGTGHGDAVVVAAGRSFDNAAGVGALTAAAADGRWLLYLDSFGSPTGPLPGPSGFDLYGRTFAANPPALLGYAGNRVVYGERPTLTLTAETLLKTYGAAATPGYGTAGLRPGDSLATALASGPNVTSQGTPAKASVGSYATRVTATASGQGYALTLVNGRLTVDPAPLTVTGNDAARRYGDANPEFSGRIEGFLPGDDATLLDGALTLATTATPASPVGAYAIVPSGLTVPDGNYAISFVPGSLRIDPAPLTVTANDAARRYGGSDPAFSARFAGFVLGEDPGVLDGHLAIASAAAAASPVGSYDLTPGGLHSGNYAISFVPGSLRIDPAPLTVTANDAARRYGGSDPAFSARFAGFVLGEDAGVLDGHLAIASAAAAASPVGSYDLTPGGLHSGNYAISFVPGSLRIDPAPLTVTANDAARRYGGSDPAFSARFAGFVLGEDPGVLDGHLAIASAAAAASPVGSYDLTPGGLHSGNYAISFRPGSLTIDPAPLTVTANDAARRYGGSDPAFSARFAGFVLGEDAGVLDGHLAIASAAAAASPVGSYDLTPGGLHSGNYAISFLPGSLRIDPAPLTVTANDATRRYGGVRPRLLRPLRRLRARRGRGRPRRPPRHRQRRRRGQPGRQLRPHPRRPPQRQLRHQLRPRQPAHRPRTAHRHRQRRRPPLRRRRPRLLRPLRRLRARRGRGRPRRPPRHRQRRRRGQPGRQLRPHPRRPQQRQLRHQLPPRQPAHRPRTADGHRQRRRRRYGGSDPAFSARFAGFVLGEDPGVLDGHLDFRTDATPTSPAGSYTITPGGLSSGNYAISFVGGRFSVGTAPTTAAGPTAVGMGVRKFRRGVPPLTPGDASFRTTVTEAPPALANPFGLSYSLGRIVQLTPPGSAATQGFVPAAGGPGAEHRDATCSGTVGRGADAGCDRRTITESYWTAAAGAAP